MPDIHSIDQTVSYFGFGTNKDLAMMQHMIGRDDIIGEPGRLIGYEVCIQKASQMRVDIPPTSPYPVSPRELVLKNWDGADIEMYVSRPNPTGIAYGTIWNITAAELELVREWEVVDYGIQEDAWGIAIDSDGKLQTVITQSFMRPPIDIDRVVHGDDYEPYIWSKDAMLAKADELRKAYLERKSQGLQ